MVTSHTSNPREAIAKRLPDCRHVARTATFVERRYGIEIAGQEDSCLATGWQPKTWQNIAFKACWQDFAQQSNRTPVGFLESFAALEIAGRQDRIDTVRQPVNRTHQNWQMVFVESPRSPACVQEGNFDDWFGIDGKNTHRVVFRWPVTEMDTESPG